MALEKGELVVKEFGKGRSPRVQIRIGASMFTPAQGEVSQSVLDRLEDLTGKVVEFERIGGQPKKVRELGGTFVSPQQNVTMSDRGKGPTVPETGFGSRRPQGNQDHKKGYKDRQHRDFHNPYNFVPAPPRKRDDPDLGDAAPVPQDRFLKDRYSGTIVVRMTAKTPLLVPDTDSDQLTENESTGHKTYPLRVDPDGQPLIPASSVRGMLRSAYEAVTNSRFGRFSESHKQKFTYRQNTKPFRKVEFGASAWDLLHESLRPAVAINQLSPADRVFGWVSAGAEIGSRPRSERVAVRGLVRVGPVTCSSNRADAVERFEAPGLPLAILSAPKPQQGRFYVAQSPSGEAQRDGLSKQDAGYSRGKGLRGRKVYPHQRGLPHGHWDSPTEDEALQSMHGHYQEFRRPSNGGQEQRDDQNRSILGWVKAGATFTFELHLMNTSAVELGALLWLLELPEDCFFRIGGGKPLGFGSVRLEVESCELRTGNELLSRYVKWHEEIPSLDPRTAAMTAFMNAVMRAYPPATGGVNDISFINAFLTCCRGHADAMPVHYPRTTPDGKPGPPSPEGESFRWFVANEKDGSRFALRDLASDTGLPSLTSPKDGAVRQRRGVSDRGR